MWLQLIWKCYFQWLRIWRFLGFQSTKYSPLVSKFYLAFFVNSALWKAAIFCPCSMMFLLQCFDFMGCTLLNSNSLKCIFVSLISEATVFTKSSAKAENIFNQYHVTIRTNQKEQPNDGARCSLALFSAQNFKNTKITYRLWADQRDNL